MSFLIRALGQICLFELILVEGRAKFMKLLRGVGGGRCKILGTSVAYVRYFTVSGRQNLI
jgi:hypothetical protein